MDFDIGNLFYVVITLVAVIIGLLGRKKKSSRRAFEQGEAAGETRPGFLEDLEKVLTMGQEEPQFADTQAYEPDFQVEEAPEPVSAADKPADEPLISSRPGLLEEYKQHMADGKRIDAASIFAEGERRTEPLEVINLDEEEGTDYFDIIKNFDAGAAVVYSAIINRLDY
jgi:hypothetical protein